jgi:hypothetical protein
LRSDPRLRPDVVAEQVVLAGRDGIQAAVQTAAVVVRVVPAGEQLELLRHHRAVRGTVGEALSEPRTQDDCSQNRGFCSQHPDGAPSRPNKKPCMSGALTEAL